MGKSWPFMHTQVPAFGVYTQPSSCSPWEGKCTVRLLNSGLSTSAVLGVGAASQTKGSVLMVLSHGRTTRAARNKTTKGNNPNSGAMLSIHKLHSGTKTPYETRVRQLSLAGGFLSVS